MHEWVRKVVLNAKTKKKMVIESELKQARSIKKKKTMNNLREPIQSIAISRPIGLTGSRSPKHSQERQETKKKKKRKQKNRKVLKLRLK